MVHAFLTIGPKGQVVIPKEVRDKYHMVPGDKVLAEDTEGGITLKATDQGLEFIRYLEENAKKAKIRNFNSHDSYNEQMEHRNRMRRTIHEE